MRFASMAMSYCTFWTANGFYLPMSASCFGQ
jgi:hypothetical protein